MKTRREGQKQRRVLEELLLGREAERSKWSSEHWILKWSKR